MNVALSGTPTPCYIDEGPLIRVRTGIQKPVGHKTICIVRGCCWFQGLKSGFSDYTVWV